MLDAVKAMQRAQILEHGGLHGIRDEGALLSALARPQQLHHYQPEATLPELAASLAFGLAKNHAFNDGNKRIAFIGMFTFLWINGLALNVSEVEAASVMLQVAASEMDEQALASWLAVNTTERAD